MNTIERKINNETYYFDTALCSINYVTFNITGSKLIQTFGRRDTVIEMYNATTGELLVDSDNVDDNGYSLNALVRYDTNPNTQYIIRVRLYDRNSYATIKLSATPAKGAYDYCDGIYESYEDILNFGSRTSLVWETYCELNYTRVITFTPAETGWYTLEITSDVDTYLYVIDPRSIDPLVQGTDYDDDNPNGHDPIITRKLSAGIPYLIIYSGYDITNENQVGDLTLRIQLEE